MNTSQGKVVQIVLIVIVVFLVFVAYAQWQLAIPGEQKEVDEFGRIVGDIKENKDDQEVLDDLERAGSPFEYDDTEFSREGTQTDPEFLPTENYTLEGVSFKYPPILTLSREGDGLRLSHTVVSPEHSDFCDLRDGTPEKLATIDDVAFSLEVYDRSIVDIFKQDIYPNFPEDFYAERIANSRIIPDGTDIYALKTPAGNGFTTSMGVEGCGRHFYVVSLEKEKTLVIEREYIPYLNSSVFPEAETYLDIVGVIDPATEEKLVKTLLGSLQYNGN